MPDVILNQLYPLSILQSHNDALDDHRRIRMDEYKRDYRKLETRYCEKHPKEVYCMACENCTEAFCVKRLESTIVCTNGNHSLVMGIS